MYYTIYINKYIIYIYIYILLLSRADGVRRNCWVVERHRGLVVPPSSSPPRHDATVSPNTPPVEGRQPGQHKPGAGSKPRHHEENRVLLRTWSALRCGGDRSVLTAFLLATELNIEHKLRVPTRFPLMSCYVRRPPNEPASERTVDSCLVCHYRSFPIGRDDLCVGVLKDGRSIESIVVRRLRTPGPSVSLRLVIVVLSCPIPTTGRTGMPMRQKTSRDPHPVILVLLYLHFIILDPPTLFFFPFFLLLSRLLLVSTVVPGLRLNPCN